MKIKEIMSRGMTGFSLEPKHIEALMRNSAICKSILNGLDFDKQHDVALDVILGDRKLPVATTYTVNTTDVEEESEYYGYEVEVVGVRGAYYVRATEFDDVGMFETLKDAKAYVQVNWWDAKENRPKLSKKRSKKRKR